MKVIQNKKFWLGSAGLIVLAVLVFAAISLFTSPIAGASFEVTGSSVKVFVGDMSSSSADLSILSADGTQEFSAVAGLTDYFTVSEIIDLMENHEGITIERVYMWPKGETGRLGLLIENGDIEESINNYAAKAQENALADGDEQYAKDTERLINGEYGIFAITVSGTAGDLEKLAGDTEYFSYVDVKYNAKAEAYAAKHGKTVSYIELPSKPDGAL